MVISYISQKSFNAGETVYFKGWFEDGEPKQVEQCDQAVQFNDVVHASYTILTLLKFGYMVAVEEL